MDKRPQEGPGSRSTRHLDVVGLVCPLPLRMAERAMHNLRPGDLLVLRGDDPALRIDVPAWCARNGHRLVELTEDPSIICAVVEKSGASASNREP